MAPHQNEANLWYGLMRWKKRRKAQLRKHPLCKICLESRHLVVPACVVDHVKPHGGDWNEFCNGALQSLCKSCHDSVKHTIDQRGYSTEIGADGWPIDDRHPVWKGKGRSVV